MANQPVIFCADTLPLEVRQLFASLKPEGFDLVFMETADENERVEKASEADYILVAWTPMPARVIEAGQRLKLIQKWGIGLDKIDLAAAARKSVPVYIPAGGNSIGVAELTIALMLAVYRKLCLVDSALRQGRWLKWEVRTRCYELCDKTVGIIGGGHVGRAVAKRLTHGFDCHVLYYDKFRLSPDQETQLGMVFAPLEEVLRRADIVSVHVPLTQETRGMMGPAQFRLMKPSAVLINTSRGGVVNEEALVSALQNRIIAGAGTDVFAKEPPDPDNPLLKMDNVVLSPHNGAATLDTMVRVVNHAFANIRKAERGEPLPEADRVRV